MPLDVVARNERDAEAEGEATRLGETDEKGPDEAGAAVATTRPTSSSPARARSNASSRSGGRFVRWARAAISGTTPP